MLSKKFWVQVLERSVKTFAQTLAALMTGQQGGVVNITVSGAATVAGLAAAGSVLTSVASGKIGPEDSASLV